MLQYVPISVVHISRKSPVHAVLDKLTEQYRNLHVDSILKET